MPRKPKSGRPGAGADFDAEKLAELALRLHRAHLLSRNDLCALRVTCKLLRGLVAEFSADLAFPLQVQTSSFNRNVAAIASAFPFASSIVLDAHSDNLEYVSPLTPSVLQAQLASQLARLTTIATLTKLKILGAYELVTLIPLLGSFIRLRWLLVECFGWAGMSTVPTSPQLMKLGALEELEIIYIGANVDIASALCAMPALCSLAVHPAHDSDTMDDSSRSLLHSIADSLQHVPLLRQLSLCCCMPDEGVTALSLSLPSTPLLEMLHLSGVDFPSCFGPLGVASVASVLPHLRFLRALSLHCKGAGDEGAESLAAAWAANKTRTAADSAPLPLRSLDLSLRIDLLETQSQVMDGGDWSPIGEAGMLTLVEALQRHAPSLEEMWLDGHHIGAAGAALLSLLRQRPRLRHLGLADGTPYCAEFSKALVNALLPHASGILNNLETLSLSVRGPEAQACLRTLADSIPAALPALRDVNLVLSESEGRTASRVTALFPPSLYVTLWGPDP